MTTVRDIQEAVCLQFGLPRHQLLGRQRHRAVSHPRMLAMYLARDLTTNSYPEIGMAFERDHSTAIAAVQKVEHWLQTDHRVRAEVDELYSRLGKELAPLPVGGGC